MRDLNPTRRRLVVREWASTDGRQLPVQGDIEGGDGPGAGPNVVGVGNEQLARVGRPELAAEGSEPLSGQR